MKEQTMFEPTDEIAIRLPVVEWNQIVALLNVAANVAPVLIAKIQQQAAARDEERRTGPQLVS